MTDFTFSDRQPGAVSAVASAWLNKTPEREPQLTYDCQPAAVSHWLNTAIAREFYSLNNWVIGAIGIQTIELKPVIGNFEPISGIAITRLQHIGFDVTDDSGAFASVFVIAVFGDGNSECVFNGSEFSPRYAAGSAVTEIQSGLHFVVRRAGGWYTTPLRIDVFAIDNDANVATTRVGF